MALMWLLLLPDADKEGFGCMLPSEMAEMGTQH